MNEELENIENVEQSTSDNEVTEVPENNTAEIEAEQERLRREHEEYLNSFPYTTVFYRDLLVNGNVKSLGMATKDPRVAESYGYLEQHFDESELTYVGKPECGIWYLKGYEKPDQTVAEIIKQKGEEIDRQLEELLDKTVHDLRRYKNIETCIGYFNSTNEKWRKEAREANAWRDDLYKKAEEILEKVKAGEIDYNEVDVNYIVSRVQPLCWEPEDIFE